MHTGATEDAASRRSARPGDTRFILKEALKRVSIRVPSVRAEEARAAWLERFPAGFEERELDGELELAAYTDDAQPGMQVEDVEEGWEDRWREFHRPTRAGPFWIGPPWELPPRDVVPVVIDPGRAFGTGAHATTRLCVELLADLKPQSILDIGCGSGVVAIAAALLGFAPVTAVDVDPAAIDSTPEPHPTSSRDPGSIFCSSSSVSRVVACAPVPNARPGSITIGATSSVASSHGGPIQNGPTRTGRWNSRQRSSHPSAISSVCAPAGGSPSV